MNVSAIIVTRGNVTLQPVLDSLPDEWEKLLWRNGDHLCRASWTEETDWVVTFVAKASDLSVYGRYAAIEHATHDLIYVQDDDVIVSDPEAITNGMLNPAWGDWRERIVANMPQEFRHDGYTDSCLVGFGACFHRDLPARAFEKFMAWNGWEVVRGMKISDVLAQITGDQSSVFERTCDVIFTTLTPRVLVDVPKTDREFASDQDRMWRQPQHYGERVRMLELARVVRDA